MARRRDEDSDWTAVYVEVERALRERFRQVAESEHRSVSGEIRRLMEQRIAEYDAEREAA